VPDASGHRPWDQVGVVARTVAHQMAEPQLPGLHTAEKIRKHSEDCIYKPYQSWHILAYASEKKPTSFRIASLFNHVSLLKYALTRSWRHSVPQEFCDV
jgi:hypothetical protein